MMSQHYEAEQQVIPPEVSEKPKLHIMKAEDDSMAPGIIIDDDVYYEEGVINSGEVGVFFNLNTKQVIVRKGLCSDGKWALIARNPDYPNIEIGEHSEEWYCFGKVTGRGRKVNKGDW